MVSYQTRHYTLIDLLSLKERPGRPGARELTMRDVTFDPEEKSPYECFECGNIVVVEHNPSQCPDCGGEMRNRHTPIE